MGQVRMLLCVSVSILLNGWAAVTMATPPETAILAVKNMTCELCPVTVKKALEKVPGVITVSVDYDKKAARVTFDPDKAQLGMITKATTDAGYPSVAGKE